MKRRQGSIGKIPGLFILKSISALVFVFAVSIGMVLAISIDDPTTTWNVTPVTDLNFPGDRSCPDGTTLIKDQFQSVTAGIGNGTATETYTIDGKEVTVNLEIYEDNSFDFEVIGGVMHQLFVKGGTGSSYLRYRYEPPVEGATNTGPVTYDTGLHDGENENNENEYQNVSHLDFCLTPIEFEPLTAEKTAAGSYDRTVTWDLDKTVAPATHTGTAGQPAGSSTWTVVATKTETLGNYQVTGTITVYNPNAIPVDFSISDVLNDNTPATVTCPGTNNNTGTVPAAANGVDGSLTCNYTASPTDDSATLNTATITSNTDEVDGAIATAPVSFTENLYGDDTVTVDDDRDTEGQFPDDISDTTTFDYVENFTCSSDPADYTNGVDEDTYPNTATLTGDDVNMSDDAEVTVICTIDMEALTVTKTAETSFTRTWNWTIVKGPNADYAGKPGDSWLHNYLIEVDKVDFTDSGWMVSGEITIKNETPFDATIESVSDVITIGDTQIPVTVDCPGDVEFPFNLVADIGELTCEYSKPLTSGQAGTNTATVETSGFVSGGSYDANFSFTTPTTKVNETVHVRDDFGTPMMTDDDIDFGPFSGSGDVGYPRTFECPADESMYVNGLYEYEVVNTARILETQQSDDATVTVTCRIPPVVDVCPIDAAVYERTDIIGQGMGSDTKAIGVRKVLIPNSSDVLELYGQLAGDNQKKWKYARFIRPNGTYINDKTLESPAYRQWAVFWYGEYLSPSNLSFWKARLIGAPTKAPFVQRAFILYPTYRTDEQYVNVWETFDESAENHVYWDVANGWIPEQQQVIEIPAPLQTVDLVVKVAVVDNDKDNRPFELTISAGGVSQFVSLTGPTNGDLLNIVEVTLQGVPAGTTEVVLDLVSPAEIGDSVAMVGATAHYLCVPSEAPDDGN